MNQLAINRIAAQLKLCEKAALSFKAYEQAKGVAPPGEFESLHLKAEFHYATVTEYLLQEVALSTPTIY